MEASKLKISPEHLRFKPMSKAKRSALRRENIKSLIQSKPVGTIISLEEFAAATQSTGASSYSMLKTLIKKGEIAKIPDDTHPRRFSYCVIDKPKTRKAAAAPATPPVQDDLLAKAKEFAWSQNSDSLREFMEWLGK